MGLLTVPEKIYDGATSLVDLIRKQFGDDIDGAAKELERVGGFPESVAKRIATGDLPMDAESVEARRIAQGYGDELYHGSTHDIMEFNGRGNPQNDWGEGTYLSDSTHDISRNYSGTKGADFQSRWFEEKERLQADYEMGKRPDLDDGDGSFDDWKAREEAINKFKGENDGVIYPVRVRQEGLLNISDEIPRTDYTEMAQEEMGIPGKKWVDQTEEERDRVWELADEFRDDDPDSVGMSLFEMGQEYGVRPEDIPHPDDVVSWKGLRHELREVYGEDELGNSVTSGTMVGDVMQRQGGKGVVDTTTPDRFDSMEAGNHTIMFPGSENQIRSVNAAFDPEYTGSNIMGGLALPVAAGLLSAGQSEDADASVVTPAIRKMLSTVDKVDADRVAKEIEDGWFLHNTDKFDAPDDPTRFGQHIEPSGQYISPTSGPRNDLPENLVQGQKDFQNPLMLNSSGGYQDPGNWKHQLSEMYDGLTGQDLSDAVRADGYDGIYTLESGSRGSYLSEAVDLRQGKAGSKIERGNADPRLLAGTAAGTAGLLAAPMVKDSGMISAPRSETLFDLTMGARDVERRLEGSLASLLFPSGLVEYLETVNRREEDPNAMTRGMALLDVLPF
jgi:hypothetical protein